MKITKHMQSCLLLESGSGRVLIDPGTYVFDQEGVDPKSFDNIDAIIITHEHWDHFDITSIEKIYQISRPVIYTTLAVKELILDKIPEAEIKILSPEKNEKIGDIIITGVDSKHGPLPTGDTPPMVMGVLVDDGKTRLYHPGDSVLLDQNIQADVVATPICGEVVMDISKAKEELLKIMPKISIPMHYDNPRFPVKVEDFNQIMQNTGIEVKILKPGETLTV